MNQILTHAFVDELEKIGAYRVPIRPGKPPQGFLKNLWGGRTRALRREHQQAVDLSMPLSREVGRLRRAEYKLLDEINSGSLTRHAKETKIDQWHKARDAGAAAQKRYQRQSDKGIDLEEPLEAAVKATRRARTKAALGIAGGTPVLVGGVLVNRHRNLKKRGKK